MILVPPPHSRFAYATTFHCGFPAAFLWLERAGLKRLLAPLIDDTRPMDAMPLSFDTPCEDEIAPSCLTGAAVAARLPPCSAGVRMPQCRCQEIPDV